MAIIALIGERGTGKDTLSDFIIEEIGGYKYAFADILKQISHNIFPWLPVNIPHEAKDVPFYHPQNENLYTPREIWLLVSKGLKKINSNVFLDYFKATDLENIKRNKNDLHIIADFRYPHEYPVLVENDITIIKILDDRQTEATDDEKWVRDFNGQHWTFMNHKTGKQPWVNFMLENVLESIKV